MARRLLVCMRGVMLRLLSSQCENVNDSWMIPLGRRIIVVDETCIIWYEVSEPTGKLEIFSLIYFIKYGLSYAFELLGD